MGRPELFAAFPAVRAFARERLLNLNARQLLGRNSNFIKFLFSFTGVQQGSIHGESKQSQSRKAIIRMLGKASSHKAISIYDFSSRTEDLRP
jgi:hypothetical protein